MLGNRNFRASSIGSASIFCLLLAGCAQTPLGPTVQVMPGPGKSFETFQADQALCKGYAGDQVKGQAEAANQRAVGAAALTTVLGVGVGAAAGSLGGVAGQGAGIGAASGALVGAGIGAQNSSMEQMNIQQQYDNAFAQCMYAKGEQVPGFAPLTAARTSSGPDPVLVRSAQSELIRLRYLDGGADGAMGPKTAGAIRAYEQANGLPSSGWPTQALLARLQSTPSSSVTATAPNWVAPTTQAGGAVVPASAVAPAAPNWVQPTTVVKP